MSHAPSPNHVRGKRLPFFSSSGLSCVFEKALALRDQRRARMCASLHAYVRAGSHSLVGACVCGKSRVERVCLTMHAESQSINRRRESETNMSITDRANLSRKPIIGHGYALIPHPISCWACR